MTLCGVLSQDSAESDSNYNNTQFSAPRETNCTQLNASQSRYTTGGRSHPPLASVSYRHHTTTTMEGTTREDARAIKVEPPGSHSKASRSSCSLETETECLLRPQTRTNLELLLFMGPVASLPRTSIQPNWVDLPLCALRLSAKSTFNSSEHFAGRIDF